jgi:glutamate-ammonia-ligase adenylyltransferase
MVSILKLDEEFSFLTSTEAIPNLEWFLSTVEGLEYDRCREILKKENKNFAEKKHLLWMRFSFAFKAKKYSPEKILKEWSASVETLLKSEWSEHFTDEDECVPALMGKLGSGELNLSSDIDLIFFGNAHESKSKLRQFISTCGATLQVPSGFKIDLDLRPGGTSASLVCGADQLGVHLWNQSDPWERYSYTRMSIPFGRPSLKAKIEKIRDEFCYRRYLRVDFFHSFLKLREQYRVEETQDHVNLKLGAGGIRDVELFVQTFQILFGGKNPDYRGGSTFSILRRLIADEVHVDLFEALQSAYLILRQAEGELHAFKDQAGFNWPLKEESSLTEQVVKSMKTVHQLVEDFAKSSQNLFGRESAQSTKFSFENEILSNLTDTEKRKASNNLESYFSSKNRMFAYYKNAILNQKNMKQAFVDLLVHSDYGCRVLSRRPSLLDLFFLRRNFFESDGVEKFENLSDIKMVQRILASNHFAKTQNTSVLSKNVSEAYEYTLKQVLNPDDGIDILFMGKMATREMGLKSDLDFILVTGDDHDTNDAATKKKARELYKKLSFPTFFGPLVPFDKAGGPMGKATPIVMNLSSLQNHLETKAPSWQLLMYLKHRFLFNSDRTLKYLKEPLGESDFIDLFKILEERLKMPDRALDPIKLARGGLFHTEFVISALFLKKAKQPRGAANMEELCADLARIYKQELKFKNILQNYQNLFKERELSFVKNSDLVPESREIRMSNFDLLESISEKWLKITVAGDKS